MKFDRSGEVNTANKLKDNKLKSYSSGMKYKLMENNWNCLPGNLCEKINIKSR